MDLADAHVRALTYLLEGGANVALNLGTGQGYSVREVIEKVERVSGRSLQAREAPRRAGDPPVLVADAGRATKLLNWHPQYSDLCTVIDSAWKWHMNRFSLSTRW
jgi:UDP-glucose 4-epimerase